MVPAPAPRYHARRAPGCADAATRSPAAAFLPVHSRTPMSASPVTDLLSALHTFEHGKIVAAHQAVALDPRRRHDRDDGLRRHRLRREHRRRPRSAVPGRGEGRPQRDRQPPRPDARLRGGARRRQGPRPQSPRARRTREARRRRPLGTGAQAAGARRGQPDRGVQPAAGRDHASLPRHRGRQAGPPVARGPGHVRRSALRRRQDQRPHDRGSGHADAAPRRGVPLLPRVPDQRRHRARHDGGSGRQHHDGARGADARGAGDRDGRAQLGRRRDRAGRARSPTAAR